MTSSGGRIYETIDNRFPLYPSGGMIEKSQSHPFNFDATIPPSIVSYTAIGRVVARYFLLKLYTEYGCCASDVSA